MKYPGRFNIPDRLCMRDGQLAMQDGSDLHAYLSANPIANCDKVVLMRRDDVEQMAEMARQWLEHRWLTMNPDERFSLAG